MKIQVQVYIFFDNTVSIKAYRVISHLPHSTAVWLFTCRCAVLCSWSWNRVQFVFQHCSLNLAAVRQTSSTKISQRCCEWCTERLGSWRHLWSRGFNCFFITYLLIYVLTNTKTTKWEPTTESRIEVKHGSYTLKAMLVQHTVRAWMFQPSLFWLICFFICYYFRFMFNRYGSCFWAR